MARALKSGLRERAVTTDEEERLMEAVKAYLAECPNAMDTRLGVTEWWLMRHQVRVQVEAVGRALDQLVEDGVLEESGSGEQRLYRLKRD
jgi:hypothetical protein